MEEKVCELLKNGDMSISDIRDNLGDVSRSQLIGLLNNMVEKDIIVKKVGDKSYYCLNNNNKEKDINRFENDMYSFDIPNSFKIVEEESCDFVAYLPNGNGRYDEGGADVIIFASSYIPVPSDKLKRMIPEVRSALYEVTFWGTSDEGSVPDDGPEYETVNIGYEVGMITCKFGSQYNFYFICPIGSEYKQMRIVVEDSVSSPSGIREMVINLMKGFSPKFSPYSIPYLNDGIYMNGIDEKIVSDWIQNIKDINVNIKILLNLVSRCEKNKYDRLKYDNSVLVKNLRDRMKWICSVFDKYLLQAYDFIKKYKGDDLLIPIYYYLNIFIGDCGELKVNLEDTIIREMSSKVHNLYYEIFDEEILKQIEEYDPTKIDDFDFVQYNREEFNKICDEWDSFKDNYLDDIEAKVFNSEFSLKLEVNSIKKKAYSFGEEFEKILFDVDKAFQETGDYHAEEDVKKLITDIFMVFDTIHLDFSSEEFEIEDFDYDISKDAMRIKKKWLGDLDFDIEKAVEDYQKEVLEIQRLKDEATEKQNLKINEKYGKLIKDTDDEIKKLRKANLDISSEIDGLSKLNFRKKDKLNKKLEINNDDIANLERKLKRIKNDFDKERKSFKCDYVVPINPKEVYERFDDLKLTEDSLKTYEVNREYMDDIVRELTYISKEVTISEMMIISDRLAEFSNNKLSSLLSQLEKEGKVCKKVIGKKNYYSVNENYESKLEINSNYQFGKDVLGVYTELKKGFKNIDSLVSGCDLSKTRVMQCLCYLVDEDKIYIKENGMIYLR